VSLNDRQEANIHSCGALYPYSRPQSGTPREKLHANSNGATCCEHSACAILDRNSRLARCGKEAMKIPKLPNLPGAPNLSIPIPTSTLGKEEGGFIRTPIVRPAASQSDSTKKSEAPKPDSGSKKK
jgi:hypothetical protein